MWLLLFVGAITILYFFLYRKIFRWRLRGIKQYSASETIYSLISTLYRTKSIAEQVRDAYQQFPNDRYVGIYQFFTATLMIRDPDLIKQITVKDFDHFMDHRRLAGNEPIWEKNLFALRGEKWRDMRATLSPSFTSSKMKGMFMFMSECAQEFVQYFENQNVDIAETEMKNVFTRFTNDVIASAVFGIKCNSLQDYENDFYRMGKKMTQIVGIWQNIKFAIVLLVPTVAKWLGVTIFDKEVVNYFKNIVASNVETREREGIIRPDMIHLLMEARKGRLNYESKQENEDAGFAVIEESDIGKSVRKQKEALTIDDLSSQAFIFFFAGFDSVAILLSFLAHELAVNPDIQKRLQEEIDFAWEQYGSATYEAVTKMKYMDMVISETLRKWPAAPGTDRVCTIPYTLEGLNGGKSVDLQKGDIVSIPTFGIHRDPNFYPEPDKFDPERFNSENKSHINPYTYMPFGSGPRSCIANRFALLETKALYFHLLRKFDIVRIKKTKEPVKIDKTAFNMQVEGGFWLGIKRRNNI